MERVLNIFLNVVESSKHPFLSTNLLPETEAQRKKMAEECTQRSDTSGLYDGCLLAIDGWLYTIEKPSNVVNPGDYFSGHY